MARKYRPTTRDPIPMTSTAYLRWLAKKRKPAPLKAMTKEELADIAEKAGWNKPANDNGGKDEN